MYVFEEMIEGKKLTEIINTTHENVKYLPGHKLPENIVSQKLFLKIYKQIPRPIVLRGAKSKSLNENSWKLR